MPHGATARVKSRAAQALRLIEERGCVSTALLATAVGVNMNEAYYAARLLERGGAVMRVVLGQHSLWCSRRVSTLLEILPSVPLGPPSPCGGDGLFQPFLRFY